MSVPCQSGRGEAGPREWNYQHRDEDQKISEAISIQRQIKPSALPPQNRQRNQTKRAAKPNQQIFANALRVNLSPGKGRQPEFRDDGKGSKPLEKWEQSVRIFLNPILNHFFVIERYYQADHSQQQSERIGGG